MAVNPLTRVRRAAAKSVEARLEFEAAIREARKVYSVRQVAGAAGLSHARVHQIEHERRGR
jgi:hypothetical protein